MFDEEDEDNSVSGSLSDLDENSNGEFEPPTSRKDCANIPLARKVWMRMEKNMKLIYFQRLSLTRKETGQSKKMWMMAVGFRSIMVICNTNKLVCIIFNVQHASLWGSEKNAIDLPMDSPRSIVWCHVLGNIHLQWSSNLCYYISSLKQPLYFLSQTIFTFHSMGSKRVISCLLEESREVLYQNENSGSSSLKVEQADEGDFYFSQIWLNSCSLRDNFYSQGRRGGVWIMTNLKLFLKL